MKITLSKDEVEKIILDHVQGLYIDADIHFNSVSIDTYNYNNFTTVYYAEVVEHDHTGT